MKSVLKLIQVTHDISNEKTRKQELSALFAAGAKLKCGDLVLVTDYENGEETQNGMTVKIVDAVTWLPTEWPKEEGADG